MSAVHREAAADTVADWVALVDACYPERDAADWDATGLQVGDPSDPVRTVLVCLDVTAETLAEAAARGADLLLAHHPLLFRPLGRLTPDSAAGRLALAAARQRTAVLAAHTNLDVAAAGTSDPVADLLGLQGVTPLVPTGDADADRPARGFGRVGDLPEALPLRHVADRIALDLPAPHLRVAGDLDAVVRRVAVCGGAGDAFVDEARAAGADVYVTGDLRHHVALDARTQGLALIDAGHHATEAAALPRLVDELDRRRRGRGLVARLLASTSSTDPWARYTPPVAGPGEEGTS
ncbi:MAG TPA: Nif3-like dinuclear metal center hexameric protein [Egibacteraceae bacterium]